jgi:23S rRNA (uracil1939-C5)-methyltransferase
MTTEKTEQAAAAEPAEELAELVLGELAPSGDATAEFEDGRIEVFGGIPGERVVVRVHRYRKRKRPMVAAMVQEVLDASPHRVAPPCPFYGPCSGCQWQHIAYEHQLVLKREAVERAFAEHSELGGVPVEPTIPSPDQLGYRNHARFTVRGEGRMGFVNRVTRRFVQVDKCLLMSEGVNDILGRLQGLVGETSQLSVRYGINTGEWLIQPTMKSPAIPMPTGQTHYRERLSGRAFRIASPSFFQVNTAQAEVLGELVRERLNLTGTETLVDAYAGVGTFAALLAPHAGRVIAIEESSAAVKDAAVNIGDLGNVEFIEAKTEDALAGLDRPPDAIVLDPPRAGCHPDAIAATAETGAASVVYISCDAVTLARDLALLVKGGYRVTGVTPLDMFPQTHHVECVVTLERTDERSSARQPSVQ